MHEELKRDTDRLIEILQRSSSEAIVRSSSLYSLMLANEAEPPFKLLSQAKQWKFLLGLLYSTPTPEITERIIENEWDEIIQLLNQIFSIYLTPYFPDDEKEVSESLRNAVRVSMPVFLDYFNTDLLASVDQIANRINSYILPFDYYLEQELGVTSALCLELGAWLSDLIQKQLESFNESKLHENELRHDILRKAEKNKWSIDEIKEYTSSTSYETVIANLLTDQDNLFKVTLDDIEKRFGENTAITIWEIFSIKRGNNAGYYYLTDLNLVEEKFFFEIGDGISQITSINHVYVSMLNRLERFLECSAERDKYFRNRDVSLEKEFKTEFLKILSYPTYCGSNVCENERLEHEHDLVIVKDKMCFIVESKSSPPKEPFRDPEKAFLRIKRDFKSDTGIQKAYDQGVSLLEKWENGENILLYGKGKQIEYEINKETVDEMFLVCGTRDFYGVLATDLSLLLEKNESLPYAWAVNIYDLQLITHAWSYFKWDSAQFVTYLRERLLLHGKILSSDELDIVGYFIKHGSLDCLINLKVDYIQLDNKYSTVFDEIARAELGGEQVIYQPKTPFISDLRKSLEMGYPVEVDLDNVGE